jgi:hypothetical protein
MMVRGPKSVASVRIGIEILGKFDIGKKVEGISYKASLKQKWPNLRNLAC